MSNVKDITAVEALAEAMETLAFVSPWPTEENATPPSVILCTIDFTGPRCGRLCMIAPETLGWVLAANVMGVDPGDATARERGIDSLKEMMNIACGAMCRRFAPDGASELGLPVSANVDGTSAWQNAIDRPDTAVLDADGNLVAVWMEELP